MEVKSLKIADPKYPSLLEEISDAPKVLYYVGDLGALDAPCLAIVGTRRSTPYGEATAFQMAKILAQRGVTIVSGLAFGIDSLAHKGALEGGGRTVAVLAQGLPEIRPATHTSLARRIVAEGGLLISERSPGPINRLEYLVRNRIISGLSSGVLVVEAGERSGALNTAHHALDQNRDVMAIPGRLTDEMSLGCNRLLRNGAALVRNPKEVAKCLGLVWKRKVEVQLEGIQKELFEMIRAKPMSASQLGEEYSGSLKKLYSVLCELELKGLIRQGGDLRYAVSSGS